MSLRENIASSARRLKKLREGTGQAAPVLAAALGRPRFSALPRRDRFVSHTITRCTRRALFFFAAAAAAAAESPSRCSRRPDRFARLRLSRFSYWLNDLVKNDETKKPTSDKTFGKGRITIIIIIIKINTQARTRARAHTQRYRERTRYGNVTSHAGFPDGRAVERTHSAALGRLYALAPDFSTDTVFPLAFGVSTSVRPSSSPGPPCRACESESTRPSFAPLPPPARRLVTLALRAPPPAATCAPALYPFSLSLLAVAADARSAVLAVYLGRSCPRAASVRRRTVIGRRTPCGPRDWRLTLALSHGGRSIFESSTVRPPIRPESRGLRALHSAHGDAR